MLDAGAKAHYLICEMAALNRLLLALVALMTGLAAGGQPVLARSAGGDTVAQGDLSSPAREAGQAASVSVFVADVQSAPPRDQRESAPKPAPTKVLLPTVQLSDRARE